MQPGKCCYKLCKQCARCFATGINVQLRDPDDHKYHVHQHMLQSIADIKLERAELGRHTSILKVKSHTGIDGNDWADILANQAADGDA